MLHSLQDRPEGGLSESNIKFAKSGLQPVKTLQEAVELVKPDALIGQFCYILSLLLVHYLFYALLLAAYYALCILVLLCTCTFLCVIVGAAGVAGVFGEKLLSTVASYHDRPVVFALSNPTSYAECTAEEAYKYTEVRVWSSAILDMLSSDSSNIWTDI